MLFNSFNAEIDKPIWIDAICINQRDIAEKEHQIPLMDQIYSEAFKVYFWLSGGTQIDEEAFSLLPSIVEILENADDKVLNLSQSWKLPSNQSTAGLVYHRQLRQSGLQLDA
jgi:hypothetical protein